MLTFRFRKIFLFIKRIGFYLPVTLYFILFALAALFGYKWLQDTSSIAESSFKDIFTLLISVALLFCLVIVSLGSISVLSAYIFFVWKRKKETVVVKIKTSNTGDQNSNQIISLHIHPILKPLLGYIKLRLNYDESHYSEKFNIIKQNKEKIISTTLEGIYHWKLPEIREYRIEKVIIYFEDFFQFFSFAVSVPTNIDFYSPPVYENLKTIKTFPRKTEEANLRIEELKKVEGEYINYKNFESNDDVRRIVWKIYAKNKELVVRIPENMDPYASHIYMYASFFSALPVQGNEVAEMPFLNYYKTVCWSLYQQFNKKGFDVRYIPDQSVPQNNDAVGEEYVRYAITYSGWNTENDLKAFVRPLNAAVVVISSLSDVQAVKELIELHGNEISFVLVPLSESLNNLQFGHWLQWLFVQQEKDKTVAYRTKWNLSAIRYKVEQNEKELTEILKKFDKSSIIKQDLKK